MRQLIFLYRKSRHDTTKSADIIQHISFSFVHIFRSICVPFVFSHVSLSFIHEGPWPLGTVIMFSYLDELFSSRVCLYPRISHRKEVWQWQVLIISSAVFSYTNSIFIFPTLLYQGMWVKLYLAFLLPVQITTSVNDNLIQFRLYCSDLVNTGVIHTHG